ncbi:hypothetical protein [Acinetobacter gerneri]|uniref:Uncharacterized protein n=1 Tax=Acinetobacter gerneri DSM 14967 = CIP 107464 = MTCC 9824 TaxID=1120926 RepID=N8Y896_9GAMM|nr:hypothetical protein [Acinetobacter gerneri]ENV32982.1 hypothetical protein F960_02704 [Acinetobacter gerneri DSM 14967 = CIP 107464 = MTCC 9824]EPR84446.1 hypothetical protein L289_1423 [Acinetobacter gerneri DSM 14967 = CIP 107464 = MTCC 9824]
MKDKPWIEESDSLRNTYGLLNKSELDNFLNLLRKWGAINKSSIEMDIEKIELLDFFDRNNEYCHFSLFEKICSMMANSEHLYWIPTCDGEQSFLDDYDPPMIAKTMPKIEVLKNVSSSFMQLVNGGYMLFDSEERFFGIIIDGYYMLVFIKKEFVDSELLKFTENWKHIDENLDSILKNDLLSRV